MKLEHREAKTGAGNVTLSPLTSLEVPTNCMKKEEKGLLCLGEVYWFTVPGTKT
jgi:hypothetical protein